MWRAWYFECMVVRWCSGCVAWWVFLVAVVVVFWGVGCGASGVCPATLHDKDVIQECPTRVAHGTHTNTVLQEHYLNCVCVCVCFARVT